MEKFVEAVRKLSTSRIKIGVGTITEIQEDSKTCTVSREELPELLDVRLHAVVADHESFVLVIPKIGSQVVTAEIDAHGEAVVIQYSEIESIELKVQGLEIKIKEGKISLKNDQTNFKEVLNGLFTQLDNAIITTPSGAGKFSPADKIKFNEFNNSINNLLSDGT